MYIKLRTYKQIDRNQYINNVNGGGGGGGPAKVSNMSCIT
jgi:hypothetical protein